MQLPMCLADGDTGVFDTPVLEKDSEVPGLLGLPALGRRRALIDVSNDKLIFVGSGGYELTLSLVSKTYNLEQSPSEHLLLPIT
eukprot:12917911-Heterocapsa_arctica.AAC.1